MKINWMKKRLGGFAKNESGVTAIEYGLIAALVGVAIIGGAELLGGSMDNMFTEVSASIDTASESIGAGDSGGSEGESTSEGENESGT